MPKAPTAAQLLDTDVHQAAVSVWAATSGAQAGLFAASGDFKAIAANAPVWLRAHADAMQVQAKGDIEITSTEDCIEVQASDQIELIGGNSHITLKGADITFACPNTFTIKSSQHVFLPPGAEAAAMEALPVGQANKPQHYLELTLHDKWLAPVPGAPYVVIFSDGTRREGTLDDKGYARLEAVPNLPSQVYYGEDPRDPKARVEMPANNFQANSNTNEEAIANIKRYLAEAETFWAQQASTEQKEVFDVMNHDSSEDESLWHYLSEEQQRALRQKLEQDDPA